MISYDPKKLYTALVELNVIPKEQLDSLYTESEKSKESFAAMLLTKELISDENLVKILADICGFPYVRLSRVVIPKDILHIIPQIVSEKKHIIAFQKNKQGLHVAMEDPTDLEMRSFLAKKTGLPVIVYLATAGDIENTLSQYAGDVRNVFDEYVKPDEPIEKVEPSIIKLVDTILTYAYTNKASDVHIEPYEETTLVRYRIDGILHDIVSLPKSYHEQVITRIKVLSKLRTDEHQAAQDGKLQFTSGTETVDARVSVVPVVEGEKIVLRLLSDRARQFSLTDLGLSTVDLVKVETAFRKPYGMILSTGPTGSGKTTTLYTILKKINTRNVNIMTIEDPIEYDIEGVNQIQVNAKTNLTFAAGLRSIVRQDPDIILVGEIRDSETAGIAVNSAMTGHLVLSTLHTNDAATTFPRLLDFGVEPFLVGSTVNVVIGQRLVRKICTHCRVSKEINVSLLTRYFSKEWLEKRYGGKSTITVYEGKGCQVCHNTGYEGRVGIFEVLIIDDVVRKAIEEKKDSGEITKLGISNGMTTMVEDGIKKVEEGITTIEEVMRVTKE